jgi:hypothetical protein
MADDTDIAVDKAKIAALAATAATAMGVLIKANGSLSNVLTTFVSSAFSMSNAASGGAASLTDMSGQVGQFASLFGVAGTAFAAVLNSAVAALEKNIEAHKNLSNVGATFGGDLNALRATSNKTYLTMEQFGKVVGDNSDILATFRGGVQAGTESFARTQNILLARGSETGAMMANLGVSFEEAAQMTAFLMRSQGSMNKDRQMTEAQLAQATANYAAELTGLSNLTGQSRKVLAEKVNEEMAEAQFQNYLSTLDEAEAKKLEAAVALELATKGKGAADALKATAMGLPPLTEASKIFTATIPAAAETQQKLIEITRNGSIGYEDAQKKMRTAVIESIPQIREAFETMRTTLQVGALSGGNSITQALERLTRLLTVSTGKTVAQMEAELAEIGEESKNRGTPAAKGADLQKTVIDQANANLASMQKTYDVALAAGVSISGSLSTVATSIAAKLPTMISYIETTLKQAKEFAEAAIGVELSVDKITKNLADAAAKTVQMATDATKALMGDPAAKERFFNDLKSGWDGVMKYIKETIPSLANILPSSGGISTDAQSLATEFTNEVRRQLGISSSSAKITGNTVPTPGIPTPSNANGQTQPTGRASGGATTPGSYLVGEEGPEVLNLGTRGDVISNDNLTAMISALSNQNDMGESMDQLNNTNGQMLSAIRDLIDVSKRTLTATKGLNGNLFAA